MMLRLFLLTLMLCAYCTVGFMPTSSYRSNLYFPQLSMTSGDVGPVKPKIKVVVTGCSSGSVGYHVVKRMIRSKKLKAKYDVVGLCRTKKDKKKLMKALGADSEQICIGDITQKASLEGIFTNATKVVLCTSAQPKKKIRYHVKNFFRSVVGKARSPRISELYYEKHQSPYYVDFVGTPAPTASPLVGNC